VVEDKFPLIRLNQKLARLGKGRLLVVRGLSTGIGITKYYAVRTKPLARRTLRVHDLRD